MNSNFRADIINPKVCRFVTFLAALQFCCEQPTTRYQIWHACSSCVLKTPKKFSTKDQKIMNFLIFFFSIKWIFFEIVGIEMESFIKDLVIFDWFLMNKNVYLPVADAQFFVLLILPILIAVGNARDCKTESDCITIQNTTCLQDRPHDSKTRCLCGDYSAPINGRCTNKGKGNFWKFSIFCCRLSFFFMKI